MMIWLILLCLIIIDIILGSKYAQPWISRETTAGALFCMFFINYIPLTLFGIYQNEISLYWESFGFTLLDSINFLGSVRYLWNWFLSILQYSNPLYFYGFWTSGFISLVIVYDNTQLTKAYWSCYFGMINPLFFLFYNVSAGEKEYFIIVGIAITIFTINLIKFSKCTIYDNEIHDIMGRYICFIITTVVFSLKQFFFSELDIFETCFVFLCFCWPFYISYAIALYYAFSLVSVYDSLAISWAEFKEKNRKLFQIEANMWKLCKLYALNLFFMCSMYFLYNLIVTLYGEIWILKELMFLILSWTVGYNLICPEDGDIYNINQLTLNCASVYCQILVARTIFRNIYYLLI